MYAYGESMAPDLQFGWSALHSLRSPRYKFIDAPRPELYDLVADPGEATNIFAQRATVADDDGPRARSAHRGDEPRCARAGAANLDKETLERLAALGYVGDIRVRQAATGRLEGRWPIRKTSSTSSSPCSAPAS